jgi:hypothetical protein
MHNSFFINYFGFALGLPPAALVPLGQTLVSPDMKWFNKSLVTFFDVLNENPEVVDFLRRGARLIKEIPKPIAVFVMPTIVEFRWPEQAMYIGDFENIFLVDKNTSGYVSTTEQIFLKSFIEEKSFQV